MPVVVALLALLPITAIGLVSGEGAGQGIAVLRRDGRVRVLSVGERAFGGRLVAVHADRALLEIDGKTVEARLAGVVLPAPPPARAPLPAAAPLPSPGEPVALQHTLPRQDVERRLAGEIPRILAETALQPASEDGRVVGMRMIRVAQGTLLTELGLRAGDVLTELNGTPTDSLPAMIGLWTRLQNETSLRATVLRDGRPLQLSLTLR